MYYNNRIDVDELCKRLRRLDKLVNKDSKYYGGGVKKTTFEKISD